MSKNSATLHVRPPPLRRVVCASLCQTSGHLSRCGRAPGVIAMFAAFPDGPRRPPPCVRSACVVASCTRRQSGFISVADQELLVDLMVRERVQRVHLWRPGSGSNRRRRLCRPLHDHSATWPFISLVKPGSSYLQWSGKRGSNSRPQPWQGCALPTELFPRPSSFSRPGIIAKSRASLKLNRQEPYARCSRNRTIYKMLDGDGKLTRDPIPKQFVTGVAVSPIMLGQRPDRRGIRPWK